VTVRLSRAGATVTLALLASSCSIITDFSPDRFLEQSEELCSDGVDNDGNGSIDCADGSCKTFDFCHEDSEARCQDGLDNDADDHIDCRDPDCCSQPRCSIEPSCGEQTAAACTDGIDNDNNGLTDCADFSCQVPECCNHLVSVITETFSTTSSSCAPPDCILEPTACCEQTPKPCNHFDSQRWIAWGLPSPRIQGGAFSPNQPCLPCPASGLVSVEGTSMRPGLVLEFEARVASQPDATLSVGLTDDLVVPQSGQTCGGVQSQFPMLAGLTISGPMLKTEVGGVVRQVDAGTAGVNQGWQRYRITVDQDGSILFFHDDRRLDTTTIRVTPPFTRVRVLLQGRSTSVGVDNLLLARRTGCRDPQAWVAGASGPGPVFAPTAKSFDTSAVSSPAVLLVGSTHVLYYTGRSTGTAGTRIGYTTSGDGQAWQPGKLITIHGEGSTHLSDPVVITDTGGYLMLYRAGAPSDTARISLAQSSDGTSWTHLHPVLTQGKPGEWDGADVFGPAVVRFRHRLYLWYSGHGSDSTTASVGLAVADKDFDFVKSKANPVLRPSRSGLNDRGITDPWVMLDGEVLHMWHVGHTWGNKTSISYAVSEDGSNWVQFPTNPVMTAGDSGLFGSTEIGAPTVFERWGTLWMWYSGVDLGGLPSIGHALNATTPLQ